MNDKTISDDRLNMFIDGQLDTDEKNELHQQLLDDKELRQRACQIKAVRELVNYAYESAPTPDYEEQNSGQGPGKRSWMAIAASLVMAVGMFAGWVANNSYHANMVMASSGDVFQYFRHTTPVTADERKIILHVTTGDVVAVNNALNEAEQLLASYEQAGTPMKLDIITYKGGINMLRVGASPYVGRLDRLLSDNENVAVYACQRSIDKAKAKEGKDVILMPQTVTAKTAQELITERLEKGWIYIKV